MEEQFDYLIRTLTYKRSTFEIRLKELDITLTKSPDSGILQRRKNYWMGIIHGLSITITEIYKLMEENKNE